MQGNIRKLLRKIITLKQKRSNLDMESLSKCKEVDKSTIIPFGDVKASKEVSHLDEQNHKIKSDFISLQIEDQMNFADLVLLTIHEVNSM